jgi:uncharacterized protein (DUF58 family)
VRRLRLLLIVVYGLILIGLITQRGAILALAIPYLLYLGAALMSRPGPVRLSATRTLSAQRATAGDLITVQVTITTTGDPAAVVVDDLIPAGLERVAGAARAQTWCRPGEPIELTYTVRAARGVHAFGGIRATTGEPFGLFQSRALIPTRDTLIVLPAAERLRHVRVQPRSARQTPGLLPTRQAGPGIEFFGVRPYQPGDSLRVVNSRASARRPELPIVNEFTAERIIDVGLILDARLARDIRRGGKSIFEPMVGASAGLAQYFLARGNRVALLIYGVTLDWTGPGYGKRQTERVLQALAAATQGVHARFNDLDALPTRLFPPRSHLILVSPLDRQDVAALSALHARGSSILVICPDARPWDTAPAAPGSDTALARRITRLERTVVLNTVRRSGVRVVDWPVNLPLQQALDQSGVGMIAIRGVQ